MVAAALEIPTKRQATRLTAPRSGAFLYRIDARGRPETLVIDQDIAERAVSEQHRRSTTPD